MRLAFVVGSAYEKNGQLPLLSSAELDGQYLARRLGLDDVGATVVELPAERGVAERIEQALSDQPGPIESVLVVFAGYGVFSKDRGPALLLDGERLGTFSFVRLRSLLERYATASCLIAEVVLIGDGASDLDAVTDAIQSALTERHARGTCGVIAVHPSDGGPANETPLASMVTSALDWLSASGEQPTISVATLFDQLKTDERFPTLPTVRLITGATPFVLVGKNGKSVGRAARISGVPAGPLPSGGWPETITAPPPAVAAVPIPAAVPVPAPLPVPAPVPVPAVAEPSVASAVVEPAATEPSSAETEPSPVSVAPDSVAPVSVSPESVALASVPPESLALQSEATAVPPESPVAESEAATQPAQAAPESAEPATTSDDAAPDPPPVSAEPAESSVSAEPSPAAESASASASAEFAVDPAAATEPAASAEPPPEPAEAPAESAETAPESTEGATESAEWSVSAEPAAAAELAPEPAAAAESAPEPAAAAEGAPESTAPESEETAPASAQPLTVRAQFAEPEPWDTDEAPEEFDNDAVPRPRQRSEVPPAIVSPPLAAVARGGSVRPLPLPSSPPVKHPGLTPPPPLPGMAGAPALAVAAVSPSPAPADAAALLASAAAVAEPVPAPVPVPVPVPVAKPKNGASAQPPPLPLDMPVAQGEFRPTVAVSSLSERFGDESSVSDALPSFGGATLAADELLAKGEFEAAIQEYEVVLVLLGGDDEERALALARLARAQGSLGRKEEAEARFAEALALAPRHPEILSTRAELDERAGDMDALLLSAERWLGRAPENPRAIELLAKAASATGDVRRAIDAERRRARSTLTGVERARSFLESSERAENELEDAELSLALALEGLELLPSDLSLLDRASALLDRAGRPHELLSYYERAMNQMLDPGTAEAIAQRIERLALQPDADPRVAVAALERLLETRPGDAKLRHRVAELYTSLGDAPRALHQIRLAVQAEPRDAAAYRRAHGLFEQLGDADGAWNACMVLEALGEADINESLLASQHRPEGLLPVRGVALDADWAQSLFHEDEEPELRALFGALGPVIGRAGVAHLKDKKRSFEPEPATLQDPEKSTTMLAKTLGWSSRLLGFPLPEFYLLPDMAPGLAIAPRETPGVLAARALGSGIELGELPFLWGRVLVQLRPELRPLTFFRGAELVSFVTAVLAFAGARGVDPKMLDKEQKKHYSVLKRELKGSDVTALKAAARKLPAAELVARLQRLELVAELAGVRAGLTLVGDVCRAADLVRRFPTEGVTRADDQLSELYRFAISEAYARLRQKLGLGG